MRKIALKRKIYKGKQCIGLQLDMWWCSDTQTAFAAITMTTVEEPTSSLPTAQLELVSDILEFEVFPYNSKTGELIASGSSASARPTSSPTPSSPG